MARPEGIGRSPSSPTRTHLAEDNAKPHCAARIWNCFSKAMGQLMDCLKSTFCCRRSQPAETIKIHVTIQPLPSNGSDDAIAECATCNINKKCSAHPEGNDLIRMDCNAKYQPPSYPSLEEYIRKAKV